MSYTQEFIFVWKIHNFSCDFYACGDAIESPIFEAKSFGGSQWYLRLYPSGEFENGMLSVYLYKKKNDVYSEDSSVFYECEMIGDNGRSLGIAKTVPQVCKVNKRCGFPNFLHTKTVSAGLKKWPKNALIVRCHMFAASRQRRFPDVEVQSEFPVNQVSVLWTVKISDISSKSVYKDIFTGNSTYEMALIMLDDVLKICVSQKEDSISPSFVECKLSLVKPNGNVLKSKSFTHLLKANDKWDFPVFLTKDELNSHSDCMRNDDFSLFCEISASNGIKPVITNSGYTTIKVEDNSTVLKDLKDMLRNHIHADIKLKVENEELLAHKSILAVRSPVFSAMFDQDMIESQTGLINIPDFEADIMKLFLEFLYTDSIENFNYETAKKLFVMADKYQVSPLVEKCAAFLESILSLQNAIDILSLSDLIGHERLKTGAINFIAINSMILFKSPGWKNLVQENVELAGEIVSNIASNFKIVPNN